MTLILNIFRKDAQRLWKAIALSWILLAWLTRMDSWRSGAAPGSSEGWLNLLLPLVWSYLIAACVLLDPLPGERQFWLTLPTRRFTLPAAKLLFVVAAIHLPDLISNAEVLSARGFDPLAYVPQLLAKQGLLLLVLTLPSLALASVSRNAMQFLLLALALAGAAVVIGGNAAFAPSYYPMFVRSFDDTRRGVSLFLPVVAGAAILWLQYRGRRTSLARGTGVASAVAGAALYIWLSPTSTASLEAALKPLQPAPRVTVRLSPDPRHPFEADRFRTGVGVPAAIPLEIAGLSPTDGITQLGLEIAAPGGRLSTDLTPGPERRDASLLASLSPDESYLILAMSRAVYNRIAHEPVSITGHLLVNRIQGLGDSTMDGYSRADIPTLGKCAASDARGNLYHRDMLRIACESPVPLPANRLVLVDTATGRTWDGRLGASVTSVSWPTNVWLSPLYRGEFYFTLVQGDASRPGEQWYVPESALGHFRVEFHTVHEAGKAVVAYQLNGIDIARYVLARSPDVR